MAKKPYSTYNLLQFLLVLSLLSVCSQVKAQLTPDNTLGNENSRVRNQPNQKRIEGGAIRGQNLFHSFKEFNVKNNTTVNFANPSGIQNIFTRVTGSNLSQINGVLGVLGNANLFLLNPNGISFGPNASLTLNGSFFATTADSFLFDNGFAFSASNPTAPPLLTINIPIGLNFRANPGEIKTDGSILTLAPDKNLTLLGGNISLNATELNAPGGNITLGGLSAPGEISLDSQLKPEFPVGITRSDVAVTGGIINTVGDLGEEETPNPQNSGNIDIVAASVRLTEFAQLDTRTYTQASAGDVNINATGEVLIDTGMVYTGGSYGNFQMGGKGGNINIVADSLILSNQGRLDNNKQSNAGDIGSINITAKDIKILTSTVVSGGFASEATTAKAGNINLNASNNFTLDDGSIFYTTSNGRLITGDININVGNSMNINNNSSIYNTGASSTPFDNPGSIGGINIQAGSLTIKGINKDYLTNIIVSAGSGTNTTVKDISIKVDGALSIKNFWISNFALGANETSNNGSIKIEAETININNSNIDIVAASSEAISNEIFIKARNRLTIAEQSGIGVNNILGKNVNVGDIKLEAKELFLNGSLIQTFTFSEGNAGNILLNVQENVFIDNSQIYATVAPDAIGNGGEIRIESNNISVFNSVISATTFGAGNAGNIVMRGQEGIIIEGSTQGQVTNAVGENAIGNGGLISIESQTLTIKNILVSPATLGIGNAGDLVIKVADTVSITNSNFGSPTGSISIGNGGNVSIESQAIFLDDLAKVSVLTTGQGNAGTITLKTANLNLNNQSSIDGLTQGKGNAGSIVILDAQKVSLTNNSTITTEAKLGGAGRGGDITINSVDLTLDNQSTINANTATQNTAGNINLNLNNNLSLKNLSSINVNSSSQGLGGNILINTSNLNLDNSKITAQTTLSSGGNISIVTKDLSQLSRVSEISTTAGTAQGTGDGGNINLNSEFLVANPQDNSDITANASFGRGGRIEITSQGIFGLQSGTQLTPQSDITAFSQFNPVFNGQIIFNTPESDPSRGLVTLPQEVVDAANLISQNPCERGKESEFIITGKGGLAATPEQDTLLPSARVSWAQPNLDETVLEPPQTQIVTQKAIQPALGWIVNQEGKIQLVAYSTTSTTPPRKPENVLDFCQQR